MSALEGVIKSSGRQLKIGGKDREVHNQCATASSANTHSEQS